MAKTYPPFASIRPRRISSCRVMARPMLCGCRSQSRVLPSTSVKRKVTVPLGGATTAPSWPIAGRFTDRIGPMGIGGVWGVNKGADDDRMVSMLWLRPFGRSCRRRALAFRLAASGGMA